MGLRAKFNLVILAAFAVGFLIAAIVLDRVFIDNAREQVLQNARIMMTAANAIRNYTAKELGPLLPADRDGKFVPETVPAYAAQTNFKDVQAAFAGYTYREPALNPTNPSDRAQDWEADIIGLFRNEPSRQELVLERDSHLCQCRHCRAEARTTIATEVDHIVSRATAQSLGWSKARAEHLDNLQAINTHCHARKTQEEQGKTVKPKRHIGLDGFPIV